MKTIAGYVLVGIPCLVVLWAFVSGIREGGPMRAIMIATILIVALMICFAVGLKILIP